MCFFVVHYMNWSTISLFPKSEVVKCVDLHQKFIQTRSLLKYFDDTTNDNRQRSVSFFFCLLHSPLALLGWLYWLLRGDIFFTKKSGGDRSASESWAFFLLPNLLTIFCKFPGKRKNKWWDGHCKDCKPHEIKWQIVSHSWVGLLRGRYTSKVHAFF